MTSTTSTTSTQQSQSLDQERADLLESLRRHRFFLEFTTRGLTDEQARLTPTASALCIGGIIKHVAATEAGWADFTERGAEALQGEWNEESWAAEHRMLPGETLAGLLERYREVAARTDALVGSLPSLDASHALPEAPWFTPGARWSARRVFLHVIAETSQHAGHADVIRETIDGQKTMG